MLKAHKTHSPAFLEILEQAKSHARDTLEDKLVFALRMSARGCEIFGDDSNCAYECCGHDRMINEAFQNILIESDTPVKFYSDNVEFAYYAANALLNA